MLDLAWITSIINIFVSVVSNKKTRNNQKRGARHEDLFSKIVLVERDASINNAFKSG